MLGMFGKAARKELWIRVMREEESDEVRQPEDKV